MADIREMARLKFQRENKLGEARKLDDISNRRQGLFQTNITHLLGQSKNFKYV